MKGEGNQNDGTGQPVYCGGVEYTQTSSGIIPTLSVMICSYANFALQQVLMVQMLMSTWQPNLQPP